MCVVNITSPQPTSHPIGTIHQPSTSLPLTGALPNPSRNESAKVASAVPISPQIPRFADGMASPQRTSIRTTPKKYPTMEPSSTKKPATLRLAQRNRLSRICSGDRLTSARASRLSVMYWLASSSGLPRAASAASTPAAVTSPLAASVRGELVHNVAAQLFDDLADLCIVHAAQPLAQRVRDTFRFSAAHRLAWSFISPLRVERATGSCSTRTASTFQPSRGPAVCPPA